MFKRAFSYIEVVVAIFICLIVLVPSIKINLKQIYTYKKANEYEDSLMFFENIVNHVETQTLFFKANQKFVFYTYRDLEKNLLFKNFSNFNEDGKFNLEIKISVSNVDYYLKNYPVNLIEINYREDKVKFSRKLIKFKE